MISCLFEKFQIKLFALVQGTPPVVFEPVAKHLTPKQVVRKQIVHLIFV